MDFFNTKNIDDLPESIQKNILPKARGDTIKFLELFTYKTQLSIDEIVVGLYRLHKIEKSRNWISSNLYNLCKRGILKRSSTKYYELVK